VNVSVCLCVCVCVCRLCVPWGFVCSLEVCSLKSRCSMRVFSSFVLSVWACVHPNGPQLILS